MIHYQLSCTRNGRFPNHEKQDKKTHHHTSHPLLSPGVLQSTGCGGGGTAGGRRCQVGGHQVDYSYRLTAQLIQRFKRHPELENFTLEAISLPKPFARTTTCVAGGMNARTGARLRRSCVISARMWSSPPMHHWMRRS